MTYRSFDAAAGLANSIINLLTNPGDQATLRLFVVITAGNRKGSNDVTVTQP